MESRSILADSNGNELPAPVTMMVGDEIIWSSKTGRSASGKMVGAVIAEKKTVSITWGILTESEFNQIKAKIPAGFITLSIFGQRIKVYRDTLTSDPIGYQSDGVFYYRSAATNLVQQ